MTDIEWIPVIVLGSAYEEQVSDDGKLWRHRPLKVGRCNDGAEKSADDAEIPWMPGRAAPQS